MANTGFIIHPYVTQVFTSGPNSGSEVSSSFNITFDSGSGYTSASKCDVEYVYREQDLENCEVLNECPIPNFTSFFPYKCAESNNFVYSGYIYTSTQATTVYVQLSTSPTFSSNVGTYSKPAGVSPILNIDAESILPNTPINNTTKMYARAYFDCGGGNTGSFSIQRSTSCSIAPPPTDIKSKITQNNDCWVCAEVTCIIPPLSSRTITIKKTGEAEYTQGPCGGINQVTFDLTENISSTKIYSIGLSASNNITNTQNTRISQITVQIKNGNVVEDTYVLVRNHTIYTC